MIAPDAAGLFRRASRVIVIASSSESLRRMPSQKPEFALRAPNESKGGKWNSMTGWKTNPIKVWCDKFWEAGLIALVGWAFGVALAHWVYSSP
jgi:hypothetical protein